MIAPAGDTSGALADGVRSMLGFIRRTAEPAEVGRCWTTIDYENQPQKEISIFNGCGGISFFLVDAAADYGEPEDLTLAGQGIDWCLSFRGKHYRRGLYFGKVGAALAALHRSTALKEPVPQPCLAMADFLAAEPPGPVTDLVGGAASNGLYLLKLWQRTQDPAHLSGAERCAAWLDTVMIRDARGTYCFVDPDGTLGFPKEGYLGAAHGISGVGHFLVLLAEASKVDRWAALARDLLDTTARYAVPAKGGLNWPVAIGRDQLVRCQWSHGAPGIGLAFLDAARVLGEAKYRDIALQAAEATYAYGDFRSNYTFCCGLTSQGELLFKTYQLTADLRWKRRAEEFALRCLEYKEATPEGEAWPTDTKGLYSPDYCYGAAGVGHFFLRLLSDGKIALPLY